MANGHVQLITSNSFTVDILGQTIICRYTTQYASRGIRSKAELGRFDCNCQSFLFQNSKVFEQKGDLLNFKANIDSRASQAELRQAESRGRLSNSKSP